MMRDQRSLDILYEQANVWEKVYELCIRLGVRHGGSSLEMIKTFILEKHDDSVRYDRLMVLIDRISSGDMDKLIIVEEDENNDNP